MLRVEQRHWAGFESEVAAALHWWGARIQAARLHFPSLVRARCRKIRPVRGEDKVILSILEASSMKLNCAIKFVAGVCALIAIVLGLTTAAYHRQVQRGKQIMTRLTPEKLIASCGQASSDEVTSVRTYHGEVIPTYPTIRYKDPPARDWTRLTFDPALEVSEVSGTRRSGRASSWNLRFFESPKVGMYPDEENAYRALYELPCLDSSNHVRVKVMGWFAEQFHHFVW